MSSVRDKTKGNTILREVSISSRLSMSRMWRKIRRTLSGKCQTLSWCTPWTFVGRWWFSHKSCSDPVSQEIYFKHVKLSPDVVLPEHPMHIARSHPFQIVDTQCFACHAWSLIMHDGQNLEQLYHPYCWEVMVLHKSWSYKKSHRPVILWLIFT